MNTSWLDLPGNFNLKLFDRITYEQSKEPMDTKEYWMKTNYGLQMK